MSISLSKLFQKEPKRNVLLGFDNFSTFSSKVPLLKKKIKSIVDNDNHNQLEGED